jgi:hypothetical protein
MIIEGSSLGLPRYKKLLESFQPAFTFGHLCKSQQSAFTSPSIFGHINDSFSRQTVIFFLIDASDIER